MRNKLISTVIGVAAIMGLAVGPAAAAPPVVVFDETFEVEFSEPAESFWCGVDVTVQAVLAVRVTEYFDNDGNLVRAQVRVRGTEVITTAFGQTIDRWATMTTFDPESLTETIAGNAWNVHSSDGGPVLVNDSGRIVIDLTTGEALTVNGPHDAWFGDFERFCELLTP